MTRRRLTLGAIGLRSVGLVALAMLATLALARSARADAPALEAPTPGAAIEPAHQAGSETALSEPPVEATPPAELLAGSETPPVAETASPAAPREGPAPPPPSEPPAEAQAPPASELPEEEISPLTPPAEPAGETQTPPAEPPREEPPPPPPPPPTEPPAEGSAPPPAEAPSEDPAPPTGPPAEVKPGTTEIAGESHQSTAPTGSTNEAAGEPERGLRASEGSTESGPDEPGIVPAAPLVQASAGSEPAVQPPVGPLADLTPERSQAPHATIPSSARDPGANSGAEFRCAFSVGRSASDGCGAGWLGVTSAQPAPPTAAIELRVGSLDADTAGVHAAGRSADGDGLSAPFNSASSPAPAGAAGGSLGGAGVGVSAFPTLAGMLLAPPHVMRRLNVASEQWLTAFSALFPERPG
jgi:hypothetical protein